METSTSFLFDSLIKSAWNLFKKKYPKILAAALVSIILTMTLVTVVSFLGRVHIVLGIISIIIFIVYLSMLSLGWKNFLLDLGRTNTASWSKFKTKPIFWIKNILTHIYVFGILIFGIICSLIPGGILLGISQLLNRVEWLMVIGGYLIIFTIIICILYITTIFQFIQYILLDNPDYSAVSILKHSQSLAKGQVLHLIAFLFLKKLINTLGYLFIFVGLIATVPTTKLAEVKVYEYLKEKYSA